jgi:RNA polymerase sigma-70 factor (ECF subfamily)
MASHMATNSDEIDQLLQRAAEGDKESWGALLVKYRERLRQMVALRFDQRLQGRIDASDVIQETYLEAWTRLDEYLRQPKLPFYLWLRFLARQKLVTLRRHHLGAEMRDPRREVSLDQSPSPETSSAALADQLLGREPRPSEAARRAELKLRLQEALNSMDPLDREVLALRHFEQLSPAEIAQVLDLKPETARKRYFRALKKVKEILSNMPGGMGEVLP